MGRASKWLVESNPVAVLRFHDHIRHANNLTESTPSPSGDFSATIFTNP
jgi:hypothetical protein